MYGGINKPTHFLCLVLKLLQLQPEKDIVIEYIKNEDVSDSVFCLYIAVVLLAINLSTYFLTLHCCLV